MKKTPRCGGAGLGDDDKKQQSSPTPLAPNRQQNCDHLAHTREQYRERRKREMAADNTREINRCLRLGNLRKLFRDRYGGEEFPHDKLGREQLRELLLPISLAPTYAKLKMKREIEQWAPWMSEMEKIHLIADVLSMPRRYRMPSRRTLGKRLRVTNGERDRLKLWSIDAYDMTPAEALRWRKEKDRRRKRLLREMHGRKLQANSISRTKPWLAAGFRTRRTWERHGKPNVATSSSMYLISTEDKLATSEPAKPPKAVRKSKQSGPKPPSCSADKVATPSANTSPRRASETVSSLPNQIATSGLANIPCGWQRNARTPDEMLDCADVDRVAEKADPNDAPKPAPKPAPRVLTDEEVIAEMRKQRQANQDRYDQLRWRR